MNRRRIALAIALIVVAAGAGTTLYVSANGSDSTVGAEPAMNTVLPREGTVRVGVEAPAVVEPVESRTVRARTAGVVVSIRDVGSRVEQGDVLVQLDPADAEARLRRAEIDLRESELALERAEWTLARAERDLADAQALHAAGAITGEQLASKRDSLLQAEYSHTMAGYSREKSLLGYQSAQADLAHLTIPAPFAGVIMDRSVSAGDPVGANTALLTLADTTRVRLIAEVDEYDVSSIAVDMRAQARLDALEAAGGQGTFGGVVDSVSPAARIVNNISVFTVTARFNNPENLLRVGMTADLLVIRAHDSGLVIPARAVSTVRDRSYVDVLLDDGEVETKRVEIGASDGTSIVVLEGLEASDKVVVPAIDGIEALAAAGPVPGDPGSTLIPISVPGASAGASSSGGGGGGGRR